MNNPQEHIKDVGHARFRDFKGNAAHKSFSTDDIRIAISSMRKNVSPGIDGIQAEHLSHGKCDELVSHLAVTYNSMFSHTVTHVSVISRATLPTNHFLLTIFA